jgi:drug/metabolite transporter (DMT)-like permease
MRLLTLLLTSKTAIALAVFAVVFAALEYNGEDTAGNLVLLVAAIAAGVGAVAGRAVRQLREPAPADE